MPISETSTNRGLNTSSWCGVRRRLWLHSPPQSTTVPSVCAGFHTEAEMSLAKEVLPGVTIAPRVIETAYPGDLHERVGSEGQEADQPEEIRFVTWEV